MANEQYEVRWKDYYQVLGIQPNASPKTITKVWHRLSQIYHPDVAGEAEINADRMQELNEAYEVLSNPQRRARYDQIYRSLRSAAPVPPSKGSAPAPETAAPQPPPQPTPRPAVQANFRQEPPKGPESVTSHRDQRKAKRVTVATRPGSRVKLMAAAGAVGVAVLIGVGILPGLFSREDAPSPAAPSVFNPASPTPALPTPEAEAPVTPPPAEGPTPAPTEATATPPPTDAPTASPPKAPIAVMSSEAEALGYRGFQVSGNPWMVDFSSACREAPCLRSGALDGSGFSTLWLNLHDLPASVRTISFDVKSASQACCASFRTISAPRPVTVNLPSSAAWANFEVAVPEIRPVAFEWQFWTGPSGVTAADGIWVDNIQFK
jgi:hypothetical protein